MKLYIVRHGQSEWNAKHLVCGSTDAPLTEKGRAQAAETAEVIAQIHAEQPIDLIIASPLQRALDTGRAIQAACGDIPLIIDDRIKEIDFGESEGLSTKDQNFQNRKAQFPYVHGEGESMLRFIHRIYSFLDDIRVRYADKTVLLACHNGIARATYSYVHSMTNEEFMSYVVKNASVIEYNL
ncbi:MAG: histidine phosphatase family protein [Ruminococcaceae bacterium]|nr:histidine phosphatase family protein [Oscillospiraceae bacterium]